MPNRAANDRAQLPQPCCGLFSTVGPTLTWVWVSVEAFRVAMLQFGPLADFSADAGAYSFEFVKEIRSMLEARKAGERFRLFELVASTGWFPSFPPNREDVQ